jgi:CubicO group peptidase (beta-lactamase class C family)
MRGIKSVLFVSTLFTLAACGGGGGGGGSNPPPAPPATNAPPSVNAGADASATLPNATVSLSGSATDDGPATSLGYQWTASPSTGVSFASSTSAATSATFTTAGAYTLTLTVSDGTLTGSDTVAVTVADAPAPEQVWPADDLNETDANHGWAKVEANTVGMTQDGLNTAATFAQTIASANIDPNKALPDTGNGMIVRHGKLVHLWGDIDEKQEMKSVTKSMGGILFGLALDQSKVALRAKGIDYMGSAFGVPPTANTAQAQSVTLAQLATHTSGYEKDDRMVNGEMQALITATPGQTWSYSDAGLNWLADVLTTVYQQDLRDLAQQEVWKKLGLNNLGTNTDDIQWRTNLSRPPTRNGAPLQYRELSSGISANANAMARVGLLFLRNGKWKDAQILSTDFITQVKTPLPENATLPLRARPGQRYPNAQTDYGVLWWTNKSGAMVNVPKDAFWAWGLGEELIVVIPSLDLVIVRNGGQATASSAGRLWNDSDWDGDVAVLEPFLNPIVAATTP